jgi:hypothetical protein
MVRGSKLLGLAFTIAVVALTSALAAQSSDKSKKESASADRKLAESVGGEAKPAPKPAKESGRKESEGAKNETNKKDPAGKEPKDKLTIVPEREAAVLTFVKRNHAELAQLLAHLKENQPKEYERAIRELFRVTDRLTQIHDRDKAHYELELQVWKTQSRIQLITARLQMGESDDLRAQLKELLGEQIDNRAALLKHEREKVVTRLNRIDSDLDKLHNDRQTMIDKQYQTLTRGLPGSGSSKSLTKSSDKTVKKPAARGSAESSGSKKNSE